MKKSANTMSAKLLKDLEFFEETTEEMAKQLEVPSRTLERWMRSTPEAVGRWFFYYRMYWEMYRTYEDQINYINEIEQRIEELEKKLESYQK